MFAAQGHLSVVKISGVSGVVVACLPHGGAPFPLAASGPSLPELLLLPPQ